MLVHFVPGAFYVLLSLLYFPIMQMYVKRNYNFKVPFFITLTLAIVVLWGSLAVGDLAEILGL